MSKRLNCPTTSSIGRLFDAVASLTGIHHVNRFEGQAAMELEFKADGNTHTEVYPVAYYKKELDPTINWEPMIRRILSDLENSVTVEVIATKFHNTLAECILKVAEHVAEEQVVLSGGCFQNKILTEKAVARLRIAGFKPFWHQRIPPNDGGIALGQLMAVSMNVSAKR